MSSSGITFVFLILCVFTKSERKELTEICKTDTGKDGTCVQLHHCRTAIEEIKQGNRPKHCGFEAFEPIVCCEIKLYFAIEPEGYGSVAKQKCLEYTSFPSSTTTTDSAPDFVIVDGFDAFSLEFPHMAILGYGSEDNIEWKCGGSLISEKFVLTAAHCIYSRSGKVAFVRLGVHEISKDSVHIQTLAANNTYRHSDYNPWRRYDDIALIELNQTVDISAGVKPACLYTERRIQDVILIASGWGAVEVNLQINEVLQKVNLLILPFDNCTQIYPPRRFLEMGLIDDKQICAGSFRSRGDTCEGDSGGPLQAKIDGSELYTIVGITSFGLKCGILPTVYTRVSYYVPWIESIVWPTDMK